VDTSDAGHHVGAHLTRPTVTADPNVLRVLQANERTLLAWVRTGLALIAFGFVVARVGVFEAGPPTDRSSVWFGATFALLGGLGNVLAATRYLEIRRAVLEARPVVTGGMAALGLAFGLALLGGVLAVYLAFF
jgi:putative membrane protein